MKKDLKALYRKNAIMYSTSIIEANSKKANKAANKLFEIEKKIEVKWEKGEKEKFYEELLNDEDIYVKYWTATVCLSNGIFVKKSKKILVEISQKRDVDWVVTLNAKMALEILVGKL